eukprot:1904979-Prymnesium_polylepis.1
MLACTIATTAFWLPLTPPRCPLTQYATAQPVHADAAIRGLPRVQRAAGITLVASGDGPDAFFNPEAWTEKGFSAVQELPSVCKNLNQNVAESEHMAIAMLADEKGMFGRVLTAAGASAPDIKAAFEVHARTQPQIFSQDSGATSNLNVGSSLLSLMQRAGAQRALLTDDYLSAEHVLLALLSDGRCGARILADEAKLDTRTLRAAIDQVRGNRRVTSRSAEDVYEALGNHSGAQTAARTHIPR